MSFRNPTYIGQAPRGYSEIVPSSNLVSMAPNSGPDVGGTAVVITVIDSALVATLNISGNPTPVPFTVIDPTTIHATIPAGLGLADGTNRNLVENGGVSTLFGVWEYVDMQVGTLAARPLTAPNGLLYYATDTRDSYLYNGGWIPYRIPNGSSALTITGDAVLTAAQADSGILILNGVPGADFNITYPTPASTSESLLRAIVNNTAKNATIKLAGGASFVIGPNLSQVLEITPTTVTNAVTGI